MLYFQNDCNGYFVPPKIQIISMMDAILNFEVHGSHFGFSKTVAICRTCQQVSAEIQPYT